MKSANWLKYGGSLIAVVALPFLFKAYYDHSEISPRTYQNITYNLECFDESTLGSTQKALSDGAISGVEFSDIFTKALNAGCPFEQAPDFETSDLAKTRLNERLLIK